MPLDLDRLIAKTRPRSSPRREDGRLVILRCGLGRDSITMLALLVEKGLVAGGRIIRAKDVDAVVFTDTGAEWPHTYALIPRVRAFCERHGLRFIVQATPPREGPNGWAAWLRWQVTERARIRAKTGNPKAKLPGGLVPAWRRQRPQTIEARAESGYYHRRAPIIDDYRSRAALILKGGGGDCTENHKILPSREMMQDLAIERFGAWATNDAWGEAVLAGRRQPHLVLLGIAADEAGRAREVDPRASSTPFEENRYPLVEMGIEKPMEGAILARHGFADARKSGCYACKYQDRSWYWALLVLEPALFAKVEEWEASSVARAGPRMSLFPASRSALVRGHPNPILAEWKREGWAWERVTDKEKDKDQIVAFIPLREQVRRWRLANPDAELEEVMAKEYRKDCPAGSAARGRGGRQLALW